MRFRLIITIALAAALGIAFMAGCEQAVSPGSSGLAGYDVDKFGDITYDTLYMHSDEYRRTGDQVCYTCHQDILCSRCHPGGVVSNP